MVLNNFQISQFIKRVETRINGRLIAVAKRVAGPTIRRMLAQDNHIPQKESVPPTPRSGDDKMIARITNLAGNQLQKHYPDLAPEDAMTLELARLIAPRLARLPDKRVHDLFYANGFHLLRKHFYCPIPDDSDELDAFWKTPSEMVGVELNAQTQLAMMKHMLPRHLAEFRSRFPIVEPKKHGDFFLLNGSYMAVDAHLYYSLIRETKPQRIVEIGTGYSTILACEAARLNKQDFGRAPSITAIDPYPWDIFTNGLPGLDEVVPKRVQDVPLDVFTSLKAGDILFIDSTHVLRSGSDVQYEFLEILPRLAPGILVHVHDVSLPLPYPRVYYDTLTYWNEQYLLQAFLANNSRFEVVWAGNYMMLNHRDAMLETFPEFKLMRERWTSSEPTAFWMRSK